MEESILRSVKKVLGLGAENGAFDEDVVMHINSVFVTLQQLGVGPREGFMIEDDDTDWDEFTGGDPNLNLIKSYIYARVRLLFDPPAFAHHIAALKEQIAEFEYRIKYTREVTAWQDPALPLSLP